nr:MAG TPA: hypothetical protein [Crassvirales sp.]
MLLIFLKNKRIECGLEIDNQALSIIYKNI